MARRTATKRRASKSSKRRPATRGRHSSGRKWSARVTETSDAMTLKDKVFTQSPAAIAKSLKRSAERSHRRKSSPYRSAMSMLTFYINRAGKQAQEARTGQGRAAQGVRPRLDRAFDRDRRRFAAADAEGGDAPLLPISLQCMQQGHDDPCAGRADRMAERAGAAMHVELLARNVEIARRRHRHHREGFVDLEEIDVGNRPAGFRQQLPDRRDRRRGVPGGLLAVGRMPLDLGEDRQAVAFGT